MSAPDYRCPVCNSPEYHSHTPDKVWEAAVQWQTVALTLLRYITNEADPDGPVAIVDRKVRRLLAVDHEYGIDTRHSRYVLGDEVDQ